MQQAYQITNVHVMYEDYARMQQAYQIMNVHVMHADYAQNKKLTLKLKVTYRKCIAKVKYLLKVSCCFVTYCKVQAYTYKLKS